VWIVKGTLLGMWLLGFGTMAWPAGFVDRISGDRIDPGWIPRIVRRARIQNETGQSRAFVGTDDVQICRQ